ncbi:MAG: hypothetical protein DMD63_02560 [Gemmatimonadetes bacterium]|nr:MAG: hypothetical protein DMD63_02560 [Gemmatimonadota bacterium]
MSNSSSRSMRSSSRSSSSSSSSSSSRSSSSRSSSRSSSSQSSSSSRSSSSGSVSGVRFATHGSGFSELSVGKLSADSSMAHITVISWLLDRSAFSLRLA